MASALQPAPPITIEQYLGFEAPEGFRDELIYGRIVLSPEPKVLHYDVADNLYRLLSKAAGRKYRVAQRMNLQFLDCHSMPIPDVFAIKRQEWTRARIQNVYPDGSQVLLAVEVISPSNRASPLKSKIEIYLAHGLEVWVVDPKKQEVTVRRARSVEKPSRHISWNGKEIPLAAIFRLLA
jgi:Uma2 family endonuclease